MINALASRICADFSRVRFRAILNQVRSVVLGQPNNLLSYQEVREKLHIGELEAIAHWYDEVYFPIVEIIRESKIMKEFPGETEGDLYLWVLDHQHYLAENMDKPLQPPSNAARDFLEEVDL
jgi:hypothetical protein